jgi:hypothetical protein
METATSLAANVFLAKKDVPDAEETQDVLNNALTLAVTVS